MLRARRRGRVELLRRLAVPGTGPAVSYKTPPNRLVSVS